MSPSIAEQIDRDLKEAMRARNREKSTLLRSLKSALKYSAIEKGGANTELSEADTMAVVRKQIKQRREAAETYAQGKRPDLAEKEEAEAQLLSAYLPAALDDAELDALVAEAIAEAGATSKAQMGAVMKIVSAKAAGRADNKSLAQKVQAALS